MKKDIVFVALQFILFTLYFTGWKLIEYSIPSWLSILSVVFIIIGFTVILLGILNLNENLSVFPSPKQNSSLISKGIYRYIRHPIYLGIIVCMLWYAIFTVSSIRFLITILMVVVLYFKSSFEEQQLLNNFSEYKDYRKTTGRFFPKMRS